MKKILLGGIKSFWTITVVNLVKQFIFATPEIPP